MTQEQAAVEYELVITRTFNAPRKLVFEAFTNPEHMKQWFSPKGFDMEVVKFDLRPGGMSHYKQRSPEGHEMWGKFVFREIEEPVKLVYTNAFANAEGDTIRAPFSDTWPLEILNILTFAEQDGKTTLTMRGGPVNPTEDELKTFVAAQDMVQKGFAGTFEQLDAFLAGA